MHRRGQRRKELAEGGNVEDARKEKWHKIDEMESGDPEGNVKETGMQCNAKQKI